MRCESARSALLDFSNGETGPLRAWAIRRHLAVCAECAEELASWQQFKTALRRADLVPPENTSWLLSRRMPPRRVLAAAGAALLVSGLMMLPTLNQNRRAAQHPGAAIAAALGRVNTWHFSGWKLIDGQRVPWDIWGRRVPWLYYERVGDTVTWADGKQRIRTFAPNAALKRPDGLTIKTLGDQAYFDLGFLEDPAYQSLVNSQKARTDFGDGATKLFQQTLTLARFRRQDPSWISGVNSNKLYTISKRDWLPMTYQLHFDNRKVARDTEYLGVRYDVGIPEAVIKPPFPSGYSVVDFTKSAKQTSGFRVQAEPAGIDRMGNVIIVVRGWLGGNRLTPDSTFSLNVAPYNGTFSGERRGQQIKYIDATNSSLLPGSDIFMSFAPLEPSQVARALPDTFYLTMTATPQILVRSSDQLDAEGNIHPVTRTESLINEPFHWRLPLPKPLPNLVVALPLDVRRRFSFPTASALAERRRVYYWQGSEYYYMALMKVAPGLARTGVVRPDGTLSPTISGYEKVEAVRKSHPAIFKAAERKFRERAVYWQKQKLELFPTGGATHGEREQNLWRHAADVALLADCYRKAGDKAGQDRTLRQLIQECRTLPQQGGLLRRQAEWSLRTGQFSEDVGYNGP